MTEETAKYLQTKLDAGNMKKLAALKNPKLHKFVAEAVRLCEPDSVFVCSDSAEDLACVRRMAIEAGEEKPLKMKGHTVHFDGKNDQGRDKEVTKYLLRPGVTLGANINSIAYQEGLDEVSGYLKGAMRGRRMLVRFFCLGPVNSVFSVRGVQLTDSYYVAHSEDLLYRAGYEDFKRLGDSPAFFRVLHSAGRVENGVSADEDKKRIYIDLDDEIVYTVNTQYAGNTVGFKKLALRLAIRKADREGWLAEHMLVMGVHGPKGRVTYFTGAFPSACGKTSTAMLNDETIVGDDLAYLRHIKCEVHAANVECGIFGIIRDVNPKDDPVIYEDLTKPGEVIFTNVLVKDGVPYWEGSGQNYPAEGVNWNGPWTKGMKEKDGSETPPSHRNARYTVRLAGLSNRDKRAEDPNGVPVGAVIYGGRDSDTSVPVQQSFDWAHGVLTMGACLESETTAATLGKAGVRSFQPMSNLDFISLPLGHYIQNHLDFVKDVPKPPSIFAVNYFLKNKEGQYLNGMRDKHVWVKWAELRVHGDVKCLKTPTGCIPLYEDLARLFKEVLGKDYTEADYVEQFTLRVPENLAKLDRMEKTWREDVTDTPAAFFDALAAQRKRLGDARAKHGDYIAPSAFAGK